MSAPSFAPLHPAISLHVAGRISAEDAARQESTAQVILQRLSAQPGLVLADEVGMGKTFVALATALSVTLADRSRRPAVVMIPAALERKWPADFDVFKERCLPKDFRRDLRCASARTAVDFLKALDDPPQRRAAIVFVTHGAMHRSIGDVWVKLALLQRSIHRRRDAAPLRRALVRCLGGLLRMERRVQCADESFWSRLLITPPDQWSSPLKRAGLLEADADEPVPAAFVKALRRLDRNQLDPLYQTLRGIPMRASAGFEHRVKAARYSLNNVLPEIWGHCLAELRLRLPLLILDEAHHLKNARTRLAGLFENEESREASNEISRGTLRGVFERMIFLTATPFQLGHEELCSVLDRFDGIRWKSAAAPVMTQADFAERREELREKLTAAQLATQRLDTVWGRLRADDLSADGSTFNDSAAWWPAARAAPDTLTPAARYVVASFGAAETLMRTAEAALRPWVIRHLRPRLYKGSPRREKLTGAAIITDAAMPGDPGIEVGGSALVPFLLAARATLCAPDKRPVFAEGLASSFEAFLETRRLRGAGTDDDDEPPAAAGAPDQAGAWYLRQLAALLPEGPHTRSAAHPKVAATARRAVELWKQGEKVLIFCHYVVTGRVLRQLVSQLMHDEIVRIGSEKMNCPAAEVPAQIERLGRRFFDSDSPARRACDHAVGQILDSFPLLHEHRRDLLDLSRRYLRTPAFLARYFPLHETTLDEATVHAALDQADGSGLTLRGLIRGFFEFLDQRCIESERIDYIDAIRSVQTGLIKGHEALVEDTEDPAPVDPSARLLPNVRLVNGATAQDTRQRLMRTFNSPFLPEILIASSVMAEGVDLHRFCRHVIHHDLSWNPSTLEQRTGRVDRIGAKIEQCARPARIYMPFLAATQDQKMHDVVTDRERWFSVVMGESYQMDTRSTEKLADRIPVPEDLAACLAFRLDTSQKP